MNRDEVLERSKRENRSGDEWQKDINLKGYRFSLIAACILLALFCFIKKDASYLIVMGFMNLFRSLYCAFKFKRAVDIILVIVEAVFCFVCIYNSVQGIW